VTGYDPAILCAQITLLCPLPTAPIPRANLAPGPCARASGRRCSACAYGASVGVEHLSGDGRSPRSTSGTCSRPPNPRRQLRSVLETMATKGATLREMASALAGAGRTTSKGNILSPTQVKRLISRLGIAEQTAQ